MVLFSLVAAAMSAPTPDGPPYGPPAYGPSAYGEPTYHDAPAYYNFGYKVDDSYHGTHFGHDEKRDGKATSGVYYVQLPDGRLQTVTYTVDGYNGYVADVKYSGYAQPYAPAPAPYKPPYHG